MRAKDNSVNFESLHPAMLPMMMRVDKLYRELIGYELVVTSARDSFDHHSSTSRHRIGCAIDVRTWTDEESGEQLDHHERASLKREVEVAAGHEFLVIDEGNHFHIQLQTG